MHIDPFCFFRRGVLVVEPENPGGEAVDITPKEFGVRTVAQEYGGGAFTVSGDVVFFANYKDQRLYKQSISSLGEHYKHQFSFSSAIFSKTMLLCVIDRWNGIVFSRMEWKRSKE